MVTGAASPLLTAPIGPTIIRLAAPNMIAMVVTMITLMAEAWYVGQLGPASLAGLALAFPMMMLVMTLSGGSIGGTITGAVARRLGAGDRTGAEALAFHAVLLVVLLAGACALVFLLGGSRIYRLFGGSGAVLEQALAYSDVLFVGCFSMWVANALAAIVRATGKMLVAAKCLVAGSAVQVLAAGVWANLFTDSDSIRAACRAYLQIVGPFYAFFGLALCLYFASQGAGRVAWPVIASVVRVLLIVAGCIVLAGGSSPRPAHYFWLIAAGMVTQALVSGVAIRLGAWTRGR